MSHVPYHMPFFSMGPTQSSLAYMWYFFLYIFSFGPVDFLETGVRNNLSVLWHVSQPDSLLDISRTNKYWASLGWVTSVTTKIFSRYIQDTQILSIAWRCDKCHNQIMFQIYPGHIRTEHNLTPWEWSKRQRRSVGWRRETWQQTLQGEDSATQMFCSTLRQF